MEIRKPLKKPFFDLVFYYDLPEEYKDTLLKYKSRIIIHQKTKNHFDMLCYGEERKELLSKLYSMSNFIMSGNVAVSINGTRYGYLKNAMPYDDYMVLEFH